MQGFLWCPLYTTQPVMTTTEKVFSRLGLDKVSRTHLERRHSFRNHVLYESICPSTYQSYLSCASIGNTQAHALDFRIFIASVVYGVWFTRACRVKRRGEVSADIIPIQRILASFGIKDYGVIYVTKDSARYFVNKMGEGSEECHRN